LWRWHCYAGSPSTGVTSRLVRLLLPETQIKSAASKIHSGLRQLLLQTTTVV
jgi:hypothetical protein